MVSTLSYDWCGIEKCPTVVITPAITSANIMEDHIINCVLEGLSGQVSGIEWMTETKTDNSYSPKDGEYTFDTPVGVMFEGNTINCVMAQKPGFWH